MTFEEWWTQTVIEWEIPKTGTAYPLMKMVAHGAWKAAHKQGEEVMPWILQPVQKEEEEDA